MHTDLSNSNFIDRMTVVEKEEWLRWPPAKPLGPGQRFTAVRKSIGAKLQDLLLGLDTSVTPAVRTLYERYPMWKF